MIRYDPTTGILTMSLVDLEHCGFDHELLLEELWLADIDDRGAEWPQQIIINSQESVLTDDDEKGR